MKSVAPWKLRAIMMITIGQEMSDGCVLSIIESGTETTRRWSLKANGGGGLSQHPKNFMRARIICGNGQTHESEVGVGQRPDGMIGPPTHCTIEVGGSPLECKLFGVAEKVAYYEPAPVAELVG